MQFHVRDSYLVQQTRRTHNNMRTLTQLQFEKQWHMVALRLVPTKGVCV